MIKDKFPGDKKEWVNPTNGNWMSRSNECYFVEFCRLMTKNKSLNIMIDIRCSLSHSHHIAKLSAIIHRATNFGVFSHTRRSSMGRETRSQMMNCCASLSFSVRKYLILGTIRSILFLAFEYFRLQNDHDGGVFSYWWLTAA